MQVPMRVKAYSKKVPAARGYIGEDTVHYQDLQVKTPVGWITIDTEEVPDHVRISLGCFGDTGGWTSKFAVFGSWGRDGVVTPHPVARAA